MCSLGASPALPELLFSNNNILIARIIIASASLFLYVLAISILSRMEIGATRSIQTVKGPFLIIFAVIAIIVVAGLVEGFSNRVSSKSYVICRHHNYYFQTDYV